MKMNDVLQLKYRKKKSKIEDNLKKRKSLYY